MAAEGSVLWVEERRGRSFESVSHSVMVVVIPASKAVTFFLRALLVSSKLDSFPLVAREEEDVSCLLGRQCRTHIQGLRYAIHLATAHPPALAGADL